jgi:hypothetical protein
MPSLLKPRKEQPDEIKGTTKNGDPQNIGRLPGDLD